MPPLNFAEQNLVGDDVRGLEINGSTFFKARLENVRFDPNTAGTPTQLRGTNFAESTWIGVDARQAIFAPNASFDPANLSLATLENVDFSGANLTGADRSSINTLSINLSNANLTDANLRSANLSGEQSDRPT
jgi:uncharacterized protein YjbI with pentapeptide repeats